MERSRAWVLNLDADDELARPHALPSVVIRARIVELARSVQGLVPPGDVILKDEDPLGIAQDLTGRAFCPTPRALARLALAGAIVPAAPSFEVLRRVNHRRFCAEIGVALPGARFVQSVDEVAATIAGPSPAGLWLVKRAHGFAGRGRRRVGTKLDAAERAFVEASLRLGGGVEIEPWVERRDDFALHGFIEQSGAVVFGQPTRQVCDAFGAWITSVLATAEDLAEDEHLALAVAAQSTADACVRAGYFGPFGIDAFRWVDERGNLRFCPRCDVNARYTMGWAVGMGNRRPDLEPLGPSDLDQSR